MPSIDVLTLSLVSRIAKNVSLGESQTRPPVPTVGNQAVDSYSAKAIHEYNTDLIVHSWAERKHKNIV